MRSWPKEDWGFPDIGLADMRPGCYDVDERVRDMDANGVLAGLNFPTFAGFNGVYLSKAPDKPKAKPAELRPVETRNGAQPAGFSPANDDRQKDFVKVGDVLHVEISKWQKLSSEGQTLTGMVSRSFALTQSLNVALSSSDPSHLVVPASLIISSNQFSNTFSVLAIDNQVVEGTLTR